MRTRNGKVGYDSNKIEQLEIQTDVQRILESCVEEKHKQHFDFEGLAKRIGKGRIRDLTEYGRVVHAEMEALLSCGRIGHSTVGTTLYCTTFPCHNCAKHIIAAGVDRVVYIEPYPKSKALEFHSESIVWGIEKEKNDSRVLFQPFVGIGPRRYFDLFSMNLGSSYDLQRKNDDTGESVSTCSIIH